MTLDHHIYLNSVIYTRQGCIVLLKRLVGLGIFIWGGNQFDIHSGGGVFSLKFLNKAGRTGYQS